MYNREFRSHCGFGMNHRQEAWNEFRKHFGENYAEKMERKYKDGAGRKFRGNRKAVNIIETAEAYVLNLYAAGLKKEQFNLTVDNDILTIKYQPESSEDDTKYVYSEYKPVGFERSFKLTDKVLKDQISANYNDGVLEVTLPKNPDTHKPGLNIEIA